MMIEIKKIKQNKSEWTMVNLKQNRQRELRE